MRVDHRDVGTMALADETWRQDRDQSNPPHHGRDRHVRRREGRQTERMVLGRMEAAVGPLQRVHGQDPASGQAVPRGSLPRGH